MNRSAGKVGARKHATVPAHQIGLYAIHRVPSAAPGDPVGEILARLPGQRFDDASHVFVVATDGTLAGIARLTELLASSPSTPVGSLINQSADLAIPPETDREDAASLAIRSGHTVLPIVGPDRHLLGAISGQSLIAILREEHLEDLHRMAGIVAGSEQAEAALSAPPHRRALYRLPWLLIGLAGSALSALIMSAYEQAFTEFLAVVFFIPALVYLADAVGTQSEAVAVRGLSLSQGSFARHFASELATGVIVGLILSLIALTLVWVGFGNARLAGSVAAALFLSASLATAIGFGLPWLFERLSFDPALGSGPIGTVIQDVSTILIYLSIVSLLAVR